MNDEASIERLVIESLTLLRGLAGATSSRQQRSAVSRASRRHPAARLDRVWDREPYAGTLRTTIW